jgi:beta-aspartyl-peptidase (threonine type)
MINRQLLRWAAAFAGAIGLLCLGACSSMPAGDDSGGTWAIALHGGAGVIERDALGTEKAEHLAALDRALSIGVDVLKSGGTSLDACERVVRALEDDPHFNAGRGAALNERGVHELDAGIMDGHTLACGAVTGVRTVKNPITLARGVMEKTRHVLIAGDGAEEFATKLGVERVPNEYFTTPARRKMLEETLREKQGASAAAPASTYGTVGCVALDLHGNLAAATSTGGLTGKKPGRVGDTPIFGAGTFADNRTCAVSGTGTGEQFIRHSVARSISDRMLLARETSEEAARFVVFKTLSPDDGGVIVVDRDGNIVMVYNSDGMFRACANSHGRRDVKIWE